MKTDRHLLVLIATTLFSAILMMASSFLLARLLSVDDRGIFQLFVTSVTYLATLGAGGVGFAFTIAMRKKQYLHWQRYLAVFLIYSVLAGYIALFFIDLNQVTVLFILNVLLTTIFNITLEKSKIDSQLKIYRTLVLQQPLFAVVFYGLCYFVFGEQSLDLVLKLLTAVSAIQAMCCLFYLHRIDNKFRSRHPNQLKPIECVFFLKTWLKQNLFQVFGATVTNIDKFLIVALMGNYTLGLYTVCIAFDALATRFINMLVDYYYAGLLNRLNRIKSVLAVIVLMSVATLILVPLLAEPVVRFFFSEKYVEVAPFLVLFIINSILAGLSWVLSQKMLILGKQILLFTRQVISILVFVALFYLFCEQQLLGVAYALIGGSLTRLVISLIYYYKFPLNDVDKSATTI
ncbi:O-antigen/teichoic acid export membrane protein [Cricetibacter osteomyelitidis]|uniref:O-antigen/teichoic acid export membrane protein n=1 Tax=Cricetibacter osteomyelitidis TaxID=1521931 RepID=A0A4R2SLR2_9PAST|nr:oligosaccharide flippase family protein [Cricetibacter osteomyelitidis]TCP90100.1 O-antigen/teichoic acid export membrane protein [Cricetibacter osteomyelitidis]